MGIVKDLVIISGWILGETEEEMEADGRRRGVPILLDVSLATGEWPLISTICGCNSISVPVRGTNRGLSTNWYSSSSTDNTVLVSVWIVESSVKLPCRLLLLAAFPHPWIVSRILGGIIAAL